MLPHISVKDLKERIGNSTGNSQVIQEHMASRGLFPPQPSISFLTFFPKRKPSLPQVASILLGIVSQNM